MKNEEYLPEDQELIDGLEADGVFDVGINSEGMKKQLQIVQIKALLRSRKSTKDTEISNKYYSAVILIFAVVQVIIGAFQLIQSSLSTDVQFAKYFGILAVIVICIFMLYLYRIVKKSNL